MNYFCLACPFETHLEEEYEAHDCMKSETVTPDTEPHVHHESEAALWWADAFPQWKGNHA